MLCVAVPQVILSEEFHFIVHKSFRYLQFNQRLKFSDTCHENHQSNSSQARSSSFFIILVLRLALLPFFVFFLILKQNETDLSVNMVTKLVTNYQ